MPKRKQHHMIARFTLLREASIAALLAITVSRGFAQAFVSGAPCGGQSGYVVKDKNGKVITRGRTTDKGTLNDNLSLGANQTYTITIGSAENGTIGSFPFTTGDNGSNFKLPTIQMGTSIAPDSDKDGVNDDIEEVYGSDPKNPSTGGNGISDKAFLSAPVAPGQGALNFSSNPAFGPPGIITSVALPGNCVDVATFTDLAAVACLDRGVVIFNVFNGLTPRQIAVVDTPGEARAVGFPGQFLPVADGSAGLAIIDLSNPANAQVRSQVRLGSNAESVTSAGDTVYVGLQNGQIAVIDAISGTELQRINCGPNAEVFDLGIAGDALFAVAGNSLRSFSFSDGILNPVGTLTLSGIGPDPLSKRKRIHAGGGWALVSCMSGFDVVDVRNPASMILVGKAGTGPGSFKQIISDGSGYGIAALGTNPRADGTHDISLFDITDPTKTGNFITTLKTPGTDYANAIWNGFLYSADGEKDFEVWRYKETDMKGIPPLITLNTSAVNAQAEQGKLLRVTANATDDGQVRNTEFFLNGNLVGTDGAFPFEMFFSVPPPTPGADSFVFQARAFDMGGNFTWSDKVAIRIGPDVTPPIIARVFPAPNTISGSINSVIAFASEPLRGDLVVPSAFQVMNAGLDGVIGTGDDFPAPNGTLTYQESLRAAVWSFPSPLPPGVWHGVVSAPLADRAGNALRQPFNFNFVVFSQPDGDHDGVPDAVESSLSLDPDNPDSKGDGIRDGDRDFDNDGLSNAMEIVLGTDPKNRDTNGNGILDGNEDRDNDGVPDGKEALYGTNPLVADTDGDGWNDETEITGGSDPLDPTSKPKFFVVGNPVVHLIDANFSPGAGGPHLFVFAQPPVSIGLPNFESLSLQLNTVIAQPPVRVGLNAFTAGGVQLNTLIAQPPVKINMNKQ